MILTGAPFTSPTLTLSPSFVIFGPLLMVIPSLVMFVPPMVTEPESVKFRFFANLTVKLPLPSATTLILPAADWKAPDCSLFTPSPIIVTKLFNLCLFSTSLLPVKRKPSFKVATSSLPPVSFV
ncbi:hypothetical protein FEA41_12410 [Mannheimia haemolytica]|nr:hypothetical protein COI_2041 [Mannheimia haemolytica serotype A2 str. OVINE]EEY13389.1 hypothetical protein COK_0530 [Mannheimia haemolytica serotype A2 str. BOVINE]TRC03301.1 hypothetical protein FEA39_12450 [Mannheimia haemolytica]TRC12643.1 hypothetical protein FEA41_12410 [Mannheimia haemolytica]TRC26028.1 hypothetical protein FEA55_00380 [Mannheimia haemolytica]